MFSKMGSLWLAGASIILATVLYQVNCEPVGGYPNSLQNLEYGPPGSHRGSGGSGSGGGYDDGKNEPANYDFQYEVFGGGNFFGHQESRRDVKTKGKYHVLLPDGRRQTVDYIADETGYHPTVTYELIGSGDGGYSSGGNAGDNSGAGGYSGGSGGNAGAGGYSSPQQAPGSNYGTPSSGYGAPADNSLGGGNRYSSRAKRQQVSQELDQFDLVRVYRPQGNPEQRFRNRRRRYSQPKKMYLIVYPDAATQESIVKSEN